MYEAGIYDQTINGDLNKENTLFSISEITESNDSMTSPIVYEDALSYLKKAISDEAKNEDTAYTLFKIFEYGLSPNLVFSEYKLRLPLNEQLLQWNPKSFRLSKATH